MYNKGITELSWSHLKIMPLSWKHAKKRHWTIFKKVIWKPRTASSAVLAKSKKVQFTVYFVVKWFYVHPPHNYNESYTSWVLLQGIVFLYTCILYKITSLYVRLKFVELFIVDIILKNNNGMVKWSSTHIYTVMYLGSDLFGDVHVITL